MKKLLCLLLAVTLAFSLVACNFTSNFQDNLGLTEAKCREQVEQMLQSLTAEDLDTALALMHPGAKETAEKALKQLADYMAGRSVRQLEIQGVTVNTSSGSSGKIEQEKASFQAVLDDGTVFYIAAFYRTDRDGEGFVSFQIVLGVA